jgi:hypothetical protein
VSSSLTTTAARFRVFQDNASSPDALGHTSRMVAVIKCTSDEMEQVNWNELLHTERGKEWAWQPTRRRKNWESGSHLTLILDPPIWRCDHQTGLGHTAAAGR